MTLSFFTATMAVIATALMIYLASQAIRIFRRLHQSSFLKWWILLFFFITGFAICYFIFALSLDERGQDPLMQLVVAVFFFGVVFVLLTLQLFIHTFSSVEKISGLNRGILDESTGIYNLRYFELRLNEEFDRARRYQSPMTMMLVEVDNFRKQTSSHGRIMSEKAMEAVCKVLKESARASDIMARYGGDQVIILLPNTALFNARKAAEKFRTIMEDKTLEIDDERNMEKVRLNYTISIGIVGLNQDIKRANELIRRADIALYKAKEHGRNKSSVYGE